MKTMSSTDTPLGTVNLLQEKQRAEKMPYIVLSGAGKGLASYVILHSISLVLRLSLSYDCLSEFTYIFSSY